MEKKLLKKMALNRETLCRLDAEDLRKAHGGVTVSACAGGTCASCWETCHCPSVKCP